MTSLPTPTQRVIRLRADSPPMPEPGARCNGCGVCCAEQPCPLGMLVSGRRRGRCRALAWDPARGCYRCRMISQPASVLRWLPPLWAPAVSRLARRWISAASGCDANLLVERPDH